MSNKGISDIVLVFECLGYHVVLKDSANEVIYDTQESMYDDQQNIELEKLNNCSTNISIVGKDDKSLYQIECNSNADSHIKHVYLYYSNFASNIDDSEDDDSLNDVPNELKSDDDFKTIIKQIKRDAD